MNEEISVTLTNNTNQVQPVSLFTEAFAIPNNLNSYGFWDVSGESFFFGTAPQIATILINGVNFNTTTLPTPDADGLVVALNLLGQGVFTNTNNIISVIPPSNNFTYSNLTITPSFTVQVFSSTPNFFNAIDVFANLGLLFSIPSGVNNTGNYYYTSANIVNANILVQYSAGITATSWGIFIDWYQPNGLITNLLTNSGLGGVNTGFNFTYPSTGNIRISLIIT
jgi:hypothetical protein